MHLDIEEYKIVCGEAEFLHDLETDQAALSSCISHSADEEVCRWHPERESEVLVVLEVDAHLDPNVRLPFNRCFSHCCVGLSKMR